MPGFYAENKWIIWVENKSAHLKWAEVDIKWSTPTHFGLELTAQFQWGVWMHPKVCE